MLFQTGDLVAVRIQWRTKLPASCWGRHLFVITQIASSVFFCRKEPRWAKVRPCNQQGRALRGGHPVDVGLTWLDPGLRIPRDASDEERATALLQHCLAELNEHSQAPARLQVTLPLPPLE